MVFVCAGANCSRRTIFFIMRRAPLNALRVLILLRAAR